MTYASPPISHTALVEAFQNATGLSALITADLLWAMTHRSYAFENGTTLDNERLEFLGDAILAAVVSEALFASIPSASEGELSKQRARLVSRAALGERALALGLGDLILLGRGERETGGARRRSILGSALEALIGITYLRLGFTVTREFIQKHVLNPLLEQAQALAEDYKSMLQEWSQRNHHIVPKYHRLGHAGPDHARLFTVQVEVAGKVLAKAEGSRVKIAENEAARRALKHLGVHENKSHVSNKSG